MKRLGLLACFAVLAIGCTAPTIEDDVDRPNVPERSGGKTGGGDGNGTPAGTEGEGTGQTPAGNGGTPGQTGTAEPDADGDGVPDAKDCDPASAAIKGTKLFNDTLVRDGALFAPPAGFPSTNWLYETAAYRQTRLVDAGDVSLFGGDANVEDVDLEVSSASTEITSAITPRLRQLMVLFGARTENGVFTAYGCGAEVVQGMAPEQRTSIVKLSGNPGALTTTVLTRNARTTLQENEGFHIRVQVKSGAVKCTVAQGAAANVVTTAEASGIADTKGFVGFFTRQTKAYFRDAKACKLVK